jgi:hypothetical protein
MENDALKTDKLFECRKVYEKYKLQILLQFNYTVETGYTAGIWGHHEHPRYKLTVL